MSIEQEIKGIIDNAMASHSQSQEIEELRGKVENLAMTINSVVKAYTKGMTAMDDAILKIKQGEVFISPATISGEITTRSQGELKTTPDSIEVVKDDITCCRMLRPMSNGEGKSDPRLMKGQHEKTMFISIDNNGLSVSYNWQTASYWDNGNMKIFFGNDEKQLPERIVFHDTRTKSNRSE